MQAGAAASDAGESRRAVTRAEPIRVLLAASEVVGFAKTGGLADVAGALPPALARRGCQLRCHPAAVPLRPHRPGPRRTAPTTSSASPSPAEPSRAGSGARACPAPTCRSTSSRTPTISTATTRQTGRGLYQFKHGRRQLRDYPDNFARFVFFCRAVLEAVRLLDFWPDVLHLNDWQTGLAAVYLREAYRHYTVAGSDRYDRIKTLFTIHNIAYQGVFWHWDMKTAGLDWRLFNPRQLEFYGHLNCLKAGIVFSDLVSTVSPTYAREIQTPYFGCGLQGVLSERRDRLFGIVNGVRLRASGTRPRDPHLAGPLRRRRLDARQAGVQGGAAAAAGVWPWSRRRRCWAWWPGWWSRRAIELILKAAPDAAAAGGAAGRAGRGRPGVSSACCRTWQRAFPAGSACVIGFDEPLAHQIEAGADLFLMPSLYEPSGLNQLYSMHYGTPPVVRATGGLADTVVDATPETLAAGTATGFVFIALPADALLDAVRRGDQPLPRAVRRLAQAWCEPA